MIRIAAFIIDHNARRRVHNAFRNSGKGLGVNGGVEISFFDKPFDLAAASDGAHAIIAELRDPMSGQTISPLIQRIRRRHPHLPIIAYMDHSPQRVRDLLLAARAGVNEVILREYDDISRMTETILHMIESVEVSRRVITAFREAFPDVPDWTHEFLRCAIRNANIPSGIYMVELQLGKNRKTISSKLSALGLPSAGKMMTWARRLVEARVADSIRRDQETPVTQFSRTLGGFVQELKSFRTKIAEERAAEIDTGMDEAEDVDSPRSDSTPGPHHPQRAD